MLNRYSSGSSWWILFELILFYPFTIQLKPFFGPESELNIFIKTTILKYGKNCVRKTSFTLEENEGWDKKLSSNMPLLHCIYRLYNHPLKLSKWISFSLVPGIESELKVTVPGIYLLDLRKDNYMDKRKRWNDPKKMERIWIFQDK
jgi:hypothetical protein